MAADGKLQSWYGIGQSLLMLPADVVGTYVERLPMFAGLQRHRSHRAKHHRQLQHEHSGDGADCADLLSAFCGN